MLTADCFAQAYSTGVRKTAYLLYSRGLGWDLAQEIAQAAWVRGWERRRQLRESGMLSTWVNSIALNLHRTERRHPWQALPPELALPPARLDGLEVERLLAHCSPADRELLVQRYLENWSLSEIALHQGGCLESTIRVHLFRAKAKLQAHLQTRSGRTQPAKAS